MKHLLDLDLNQKRVGIRVDLNVPIENGKILNDERLLAALPSILHILKYTNELTIITHLGRPQEGIFDEALSVRPIMEWFQNKLKRKITLSRDFDSLGKGISFVENVRFQKFISHERGFSKNLEFFSWGGIKNIVYLLT